MGSQFLKMDKGESLLEDDELKKEAERQEVLID